MNVPFYIICTALIVSVSSEENMNNPPSVAENHHFLNRESSNLLRRLLEPVNMEADPETINYILPKLVAKYRPNTDWRTVTDPRFYLLTEMESNGISPETALKKTRNKRYNYARDYSPTLSVQAPIQALRNAYDLNTFRQKLLQNRRLIEQISSQAVQTK